MVLIRIKDGFKLNGDGEFLGIDYNKEKYTFWRSAGNMDVPPDLALKLELEQPQRFEIVDKNYAKYIKDIINLEPKVIEKVVIKEVITKPELDLTITLKELKEMTRDDINDWCVPRDYDVDGAWSRKKIINELTKQIEKRTGIKI